MYAVGTAEKILRENTGHLEDGRILYGGPVKPENSFAIHSQNDINYVLIGKASLKIDTVSDIIEIQLSW